MAASPSTRSVVAPARLQFNVVASFGQRIANAIPLSIATPAAQGSTRATSGGSEFQTPSPRRLKVISASDACWLHVWLAAWLIDWFKVVSPCLVTHVPKLAHPT